MVDGCTKHTVDGIRYFVPMSNDEGGVSQSISLHGTYESSLTRFFDRLLVPGATVLDIGANIGWFTVRFSRRIGGAGRVLAFEPEPTNLQILRGNLAELGLGAGDAQRLLGALLAPS